MVACVATATRAPHRVACVGCVGGIALPIDMFDDDAFYDRGAHRFV